MTEQFTHTAQAGPDDPGFEPAVRVAFERNLARLEPMVPATLPPLRRAPDAGVQAPTFRVRSRESASLGLAAAIVLIAVLAGVTVFGQRHQPAATPSPSALWTSLRWDLAKTDGKIVPDRLRGSQTAAWHDGWVLVDIAGASFSADGGGWDRTLDFPTSTYSDGVWATPTGFVAFAVYSDGASDANASPLQTAIWVSTDGRSWRRAETSAFDGQNQVWDMAAGPRGFVAVGQTGPKGETAHNFGAWFSRDGLSWQRIERDPAIFGNHPPYAVVAVPDGFLMSGTLNNSGYGPAMIWRSSDGLHWERCDVPDGSSWPGGGAIAAGSRGVVAIPVNASDRPRPTDAWTSADGGHAWTSTAMQDPPNFVTGDGTRIVARWDAQPPEDVANTRKAVSLDGVHWSPVADYPYSFWLGFSPDHVLALRGDMVYAVPAVAAPAPDTAATPVATASPSVGLSPSTVVTPKAATATPDASPEGWGAVEWPAKPATDIPNPDLVAVGPKGVVEVARQPAAATEPPVIYYAAAADAAWERADTSDPSLAHAVITHVVGAGDGFVAIGWKDGAVYPAPLDIGVWTSRDGIGWKPVATSAFDGRATVNAVGVGNGGLVAVGTLNGNTSLWRSNDGAHWSVVNLPSAFDGGLLNDVEYSERFGWTVVGNVGDVNGGPAIWQSPDGTAWTRRMLEGKAGGFAQSVFLGSDGILVLGYAANPGDSPGPATAWTSHDGDRWSVSSAAPLETVRVLSDGRRIVRSDGQTIEESFDGVDWHQISIVYPEVAYASFDLIALCPDGLLVTTNTDGAYGTWYLKARTTG